MCLFYERLWYPINRVCDLHLEQLADTVFLHVLLGILAGVQHIYRYPPRADGVSSLLILLSAPLYGCCRPLLRAPFFNEARALIELSKLVSWYRDY